MTYLLDRDQEQRERDYQAIEDIYLEGVTDGTNGRLPAMSEIIYLQGYCKGMEQSRADIGLQITVSASSLQSEMFEVETEYPLLCGQCAHLINGRCGIKGASRNSSQYACEEVLVNTPF
ncbi:MAG: hypothetical protein ACRCZS_06635 [Chroococcidiopsis sp.]